VLFGDVTRGGIISLTDGEPFRWGSGDYAGIAAIKAGLRYEEESFALSFGLFDGLVREAVVTRAPYAERVHATKTIPGMHAVSAVVTISCLDGYVLTTRADWVNAPGKIYPVCESASAADIGDNILDYSQVGLRAIEEELGIGGEHCRIRFQRQIVNFDTLVGVMHANIDLTFSEVVECWERASHADEGTPLLVDIFSHGRFLKRAMPDVF
jgi:hypothetical protein